MSAHQDSLIELIRRTSAEIPDDVQKAILDSLEGEKKGTIAESALKIIERNIALAKEKSQPICQDTGSILFYVDCTVGMDQIAFEDAACLAVKKATTLGYLRQNSVDSLTGLNDGTNFGPGSPALHFHQQRSDETDVRLVLKGGGCENDAKMFKSRYLNEVFQNPKYPGSGDGNNGKIYGRLMQQRGIL